MLRPIRNLRNSIVRWYFIFVTLGKTRKLDNTKVEKTVGHSNPYTLVD